MARTVLGLAGSCRREGNTETLLDWCLAAAEAEGAEVVRFRLADLDLHPCRGCEACSKTGECIVGDDMRLLYPYLQGADALVVASPVYSMGIPALPKMVIDRCQPFWALKYVLKRPLPAPEAGRRLGAFLCCAGTTFQTVFDGSLQVMRYLWHVLEIEPAGDLLCPGVDAKGEIEEETGARAVAEEIGRRLALGPEDEGEQRRSER